MQTQTGVFLRSWKYAAFSLRLSLHLSAKVFPNYKLEFQDGQGMEVEVIILESLGSPHHTHTHTHTHQHTHTPTHTSSPRISTSSPTLWPHCGWRAFDSLGFSFSARTTAPFPKVAAFPEMFSLACDLNLHYITSHFASKHSPQAPSLFFHLLTRWLGPPKVAGSSKFPHGRPHPPLGNDESGKSFHAGFEGLKIPGWVVVSETTQ